MAARRNEVRAKSAGGFETEIFDGSEGPSELFPDACALIGRDSDGLDHFIGTGVAVHSRLVLTAVHVARNAPNFAYFPAAGILNPAPSIQHPIEPQWDNCGPIAMLYLRPDGPTLEFPILATSDDFTASRTGVIVGFGQNAPRRGERIKRHGDKMTIKPWPPSEDPAGASSQFFVTGHAGNCLFDSGGPFYTRLRGGNILAGIANRRPESPRIPCGPNGVYLRVDPQRECIRAKAAAHGISLV